jgi:membrane protease YdiL (CAAX protease family)
LLDQRSGRNSINWGGLGFAVFVFFMAFFNGLAAFVVSTAVESAERVEVERQGKIVVSRSFLELIKTTDPESQGLSAVEIELDQAFSREAREIAREHGGAPADIEQKLRATVRSSGSRALVTAAQASPGLKVLPGAGFLPAMLGSVVLLWWAMMLVFQGEGVDLDVQRRRHPMWEWLFSHPVPPGAIFLAEMLSPLAANPIFLSAPLFVGFLYGFVYGPELGFLAAFLMGIPVTVAAACLGKALEIGVTLRFSPRSRGAVLGLMGWIGYASMILLFVALVEIPKVVQPISKYLDVFAVLPWPWLRLFLGGQTDGSFSFPAGMLACWTGAGITGASAVWFSVWGTQQGLSGNVGRADSGPTRGGKIGVSFGREPLYRKEFLWFVRDRSAVVQAILIPVTMAGVQLFNFRSILSNVEGGWNYFCGAAILFGTYFLWILGPKSLASEGTALWIALTWPRGLESLLKAKAWLWSMISSGLVLLVLSYAAFLFPADLWKIGLLGVAWFFFSRSMAEKSVTLVSVTSESGEPQKIPQGRRWAAALGMMTFSIGVLTQRWHLAFIGIVYSYLTAAAMWQNFRARLPYLYDPWSETLPPPPTLMHAMIAISILVDGGAVVTAILALAAGPENVALAQAVSYAVCAVVVSIGATSFLRGRGVPPEEVWRWRPSASAHETQEPGRRADSFRNSEFFFSLPGAAGGLVLGLLAHGYTALLLHIPAAAEMIRRSQEVMAKMPGFKASYFVMAVVFAPFAEEYLFRGLLFRALDREWGGWRAVLGSAAFFAIYHPPLSWAPVGLLGIVNALLFKKTGRLLPAVILHMVYNAVVLL